MFDSMLKLALSYSTRSNYSNGQNDYHHNRLALNRKQINYLRGVFECIRADKRQSDSWLQAILDHELFLDQQRTCLPYFHLSFHCLNVVQHVEPTPLDIQSFNKINANTGVIDEQMD